uniref:Uncharacterized protein n=1 Tax=Zea mays TaxID=4577 RepID=A0A804LNE0_MAIZE
MTIDSRHTIQLFAVPKPHYRSDEAKNQTGLGRVPCGVLWEVLAGLSLPERVEVAAGAELHDKAGEAVGLEVRVQSGQERVVQQLQDLPLRLRATQLPPALQRRLVHDLHREPAGPRRAAVAGASAAQLGQVHRPDVAAPEPPQQPEAAHREGPVARARREDGLPPGVAALVRLPGAAAGAGAGAVAPAAAVAGRAAADAGLGAPAGDGAARREACDCHGGGGGAGAVDAAVRACRAARRRGRVPRDDWLLDRLLPAVDSDKDGVYLVHRLRRVARPGEGAPRRRFSVHLVVAGRNADPDLVELEPKNLLRRHLAVSIPHPAAHLELEHLRDEPKLEVPVLRVGSRIQGRLQLLCAKGRVRCRSSWVMFGVLCARPLHCGVDSFFGCVM